MFVVQGNALKLKKEHRESWRHRSSATNDSGQALYRDSFRVAFALEVGSTLSVTYPKPGKPVVKAATILDDLRRRDFTANAMALSLNDGSYGLLMDPLNGVADIENQRVAAGEQLRIHRRSDPDGPGGAIDGATGLADG